MEGVGKSLKVILTEPRNSKQGKMKLLSSPILPIVHRSNSLHKEQCFFF